MKEVCLDARMVLSGGIGTVIKNLALHLKEAPFRLRLLADPKALLPWMSAFDLIPCTSSIYSAREQFDLPLSIPRCDLFWSPNFNVPLLPIRARKRLATVQDAFHLAFYASLKPLEKLYVKTVMRGAFRVSDHIATISHFSRSELIRYGNIEQAKITTIPLGIDSELFHPRPIAKRVDLPDRYVLFVGNLKPHKNIHGLFEAFDRLNQPGLTLLVVGKKSGFITGVDLEQEKIHPNIRFLDYVDEHELPMIYQHAECLILPSFYEGFGLPPLEAMGCGCPVVVSQAASLPEVCGDAAAYVDPANIQDMTDKMARVIADASYRKELIENGFKRVELFSWKKTAEAYEKLIDGMCP